MKTGVGMVGGGWRSAHCAAQLCAFVLLLLLLRMERALPAGAAWGPSVD